MFVEWLVNSHGLSSSFVYVHERWTNLLSQLSYNSYALGPYYHRLVWIKLNKGKKARVLTRSQTLSLLYDRQVSCTLTDSRAFSSTFIVFQTPLRVSAVYWMTIVNSYGLSFWFDYEHESWTNLFSRLSYNFHARLTRALLIRPAEETIYIKSFMCVEMLVYKLTSNTVLFRSVENCYREGLEGSRSTASPHHHSQGHSAVRDKELQVSRLGQILPSVVVLKRASCLQFLPILCCFSSCGSVEIITI